MSKFGNKKVVIDGIKFDSIGEGARYLMLKDQNFKNLKVHVKYELIPPVHEKKKTVQKAITYTADFVYQDGDRIVVEDFKGVETQAFKIKKKLFFWKYGTNILITKEKDVPNRYKLQAKRCLTN